MIDPEGVVYDLSNHQPLSGSSVACLLADAAAAGAGNSAAFTLWPAVDYDQVNPRAPKPTATLVSGRPPAPIVLRQAILVTNPIQAQIFAVIDQPVHEDVLLTPAIADAATQVIEASATALAPWSSP